MTNVERQVARLGKFSKVRPSGVRDLKLTGSKLTWTEPADTKYITHYNIRVGSDIGAPTYQVQVGQTSCTVSPGDTNFWVSSANKTMGTESPMSYALGVATIPPAAVSSMLVQVAYA